ncbi:MAG: 2-oxoisovalerate dehydrogenase [Sphingobacteriales bacterium]|nr:MAG: 2-oxoisovalerate dehydrogenase [Sphingobacteriales bacterium]
MSQHPVNTEIIFIVEETPENAFTARALGYGIYTEADTLPELREMVRDAVLCHFEENNKPALIRLHFVKQELIIV